MYFSSIGLHVLGSVAWVFFLLFHIASCILICFFGLLDLHNGFWKVVGLS